MSKTYMRKESGDDQKIVCISLSDWARYRQSGYVFVEKDADGNTPQQQFVAQDNSAPEREAKPTAKKKAKKKASKKKS